MISITKEIQINAPKDKVWAALADLGSVQNFNPVVKKSYYTSTEKAGIGAARVCELLPQGAVEERATEWQTGERFVLEVLPLEQGPPFENAYGHVSVKEDDQGTLVTYGLDFDLQAGVPIDAATMKAQIEMLIPVLLANLKQYVETGKILTLEEKMAAATR